MDRVGVEPTSPGGFMPAFLNATYPYLDLSLLTLAGLYGPVSYGFQYYILRPGALVLSVSSLIEPDFIIRVATSYYFF